MSGSIAPQLSGRLHRGSIVTRRGDGPYLLGLVGFNLALWLATLWFALPCLTLYQVHTAVRQTDTATLERLVDWPAVRADVRGAVLAKLRRDWPASGGTPGERLADGFGSAVAAGVLGLMVEAMVTPDGLIEGLRQRRIMGGEAERPGLIDLLRLVPQVYPTGPASLAAQLSETIIPGMVQPADSGSPARITLRLGFSHLGWRVTGIDIPAAVMDRWQPEG